MTPEEAVFVDDKTENVLAAKSLGINSIVFDDKSTVPRSLRNIFDGPVERGYKYLYRNVKQLYSMTDSGVVIPEIFSQLLILDAIQDR